MATGEATEQMAVPEGHEVMLYRMAPSPSIASTDAVAWLAHLGTSSDEAEEELDTILGRVDALMQGGRPRIILATRAERLSSLMAPSNPEVVAHPHGMLVWTVDAAGLAGAPRGPSLVQRWLRCIYTTGTRGAPPLQYVFLSEIASPRARAVAALVRGLGLDVRVPDAQNGLVVVEVRRPEGVTLSAIPGAPRDLPEPPDGFTLEVNKAKDRAEEAGDTAQLQRLEAEERDALESKLAPEAGASRVSHVRRAPRLHRLLLAVADHGDTARPALYEELLRREVPLQLLVDPSGRGSRHDWPGGITALPVYADETTLRKSARDQGRELGAFASAVMTPPELFDWAAGQSWAIAMNTFRAPDQPVYLVLTAEVVKALARGTMPASSATPLSSVEVSRNGDVTVTARYTYLAGETMESVGKTFPPGSFDTVDTYVEMDGLMLVVVEITVTPKAGSVPVKLTTTFRIPSGGEVQKPWQGAAGKSSGVFRAILTVPEGARYVATALRG